MIPSVEQVAEAITVSAIAGGQCIGLRLLRPEDVTRIGGRLRHSYRWEEGVRTSQRLPGTCAVGIIADARSIEDWEDLLPGWIKLALATVQLYGEGPVALVTGNLVSQGEDDYDAPEYIISQCRVLAVWA